ncbi:MAG: hypothetical protein IJP62_01285 [Treponema sp.]|nr:hypothetical protein [Treponema sp.]
MTLKTRNSLIKLFFIFSLVCIALTLVCLSIALITKNIVPPVNLRLPEFLLFIPFSQYNLIATLVSTGIMMLYVPIMLLLLMRYFENTQSTEIIFFSGAVIGCLCEGMRFLILLFGLWQSYSQLLFFIGRIVLAGRLLVPLSFFAAATMSETSQRQNVERNATVLLGLSVVIAITMPLNTAQVTTTGMIVTGFAQVFTIVRVLIFLVTLASFFINARRHDSIELTKITIDYAILMIGYGCLLIADNFLFMGIGTAALGIGTAYFLRNLHRLYMWK